MSSTSLIAVSGMRSAQSQLHSAAHNIANLGTTGFRRQESAGSTLAGGGVGSSIGPAAAPGHALETDMVGLLQARNAFLANLAVFKTGDQMTGTLLDAFG